MRHAGKDDVRFQTAHQAKQGESRGSNPVRTQCVHGCEGGRAFARNGGLCHQSEVNFIFIRRQSPCQQFSDAFGAASAEVGNQ